jgi:hypothetical protein
VTELFGQALACAALLMDVNGAALPRVTLIDAAPPLQEARKR